jgi:anti-sigma-K factor RskA
MSTHPSWDTLNDYVDGVIAADQRAGVTRHLGVCAECRARLTDLEETLRQVAAMAPEIAPPPDAWPAIRAGIEQRKVVTLPGARGPGVVSSPGWGIHRWRLAAAAVVLIAASSAVTTLVVRRTGGAPAPSEVATPTPGAGSSLPVALLEVERGFVGSVRELSDALDAARPHLAAETVAIVERNLALIDAAIAESRAALVRDPGNRVLQDVLAGTYRQKLDLLRRAAQLASS